MGNRILYSSVPKYRYTSTPDKWLKNGFFQEKNQSWQTVLRNKILTFAFWFEATSKWLVQTGAFSYASIVVITQPCFTEETRTACLKIVVLPLFQPSLPFHCSALSPLAGKCLLYDFGYNPENIVPIEAWILIESVLQDLLSRGEKVKRH